MSIGKSATTMATAVASLAATALMVRLILPWCKNQYDARIRRGIRATVCPVVYECL